jgi:hypothetical protein
MLADALVADHPAQDDQPAQLLQWTDSESVHAAVAAQLEALRDDDAGGTITAIHRLPEKPASMTPSKACSGQQLFRLGELPMVRVDQLCRHSAALQATVHQVAERQARVHPDDLRKLKLTDQGRVLIRQGECQAEATVVADSAVASGTVCIPLTTALAAELGPAFGSVSVQPVSDAQQALDLAADASGEAG